MQLVLGLGNPGPRYRGTRHNVGFRCVEALAVECGLGFDLETPEYREAAGPGPAGPLTLLEPLTYMNRSGEAVTAWSRRRGWTVGSAPISPPEDEQGDASFPTYDLVPIVVCDDLHLPLGSIRIRAGGSDGGQNGLASVLAVCGGEGVPRLRLGVGPRSGAVPPESWADWVLQDFAPAELEAVADLVAAGSAALADLLRFGPQRAASRHNRRIRAEADLPDDD